MQSLESVPTMLISARRREQRARFGALLASSGQNRLDSGGFSERSVDAAGPFFGVLEPDVIALLFGRVLLAGHDVPCLHRGASGDRLELASRAHIRSAAAHVYALASTCRYMRACFGYNGSVVRLEAAAATCTSLAPMRSRRALHNALIDTPMFDQLVQEERSRFDLQMLESALLSMVTHCADTHCLAMRRAHNVRIAKQVPERLKKDAVLRHLLGAQKPVVKVVHTSDDHVNIPVGGMCVRSEHAECIVATKEGDQTNLTCLRAEPPLELCPNSALRCVWKLPLSRPLSSAEPQPPLSQWRVRCIALSPCGEWVAVTHFRPPHANVELTRENVLTVWHTTRPLEPRGSFRLRNMAISAMWFRKAEVASCHMADGEYRPNATILCFCATKKIPPPLWSNQLNFWYPSAHSIGITKLYQYCVEDGSLKTDDDTTLPECHGVVLKPAGTRIDMAHSQQTHEGIDTVYPIGICDETSIVSISVPTECRDSFGVCLFGLADVGVPSGVPGLAVPPGVPTSQDPFAVGLAYRSLAVQQCVVLDLSYEHRHDNGTAPLRSTLPMNCVAGHHPPLQQFVQLSPRGDLAVVLVVMGGQVVNNTNQGYFVHIYGRRGHDAPFWKLAQLDLNRAVNRFRTERALEAALVNPEKPPRPDGCVRIRSAPISRAFSPCGRFLLYGFSDGVHFYRGEDSPQAFMHPPLHADGGVCVFDLSEIWEARSDATSSAGAAAVAWIECKANVVPMRMRWTPAGLWLTTRRGLLLLGTDAACAPCG